jgi:type IV secretory pathway TrbD component
MESLQGWNLALFGVAIYVAVVALVRLMLRRRDQIVGDIQQQVAAEQQRRKRRPPDERDQAA